MDQNKSFRLGSGPLKVDKEVDLLGSERSENHFRLSTSAIQDECTVPPHPAHRSALPSLDSFSPDNPLIITQDPRADFQVIYVSLILLSRCRPWSIQPAVPQQELDRCLDVGM